MNLFHICAGWEKWNGAANIARLIAREQEETGNNVVLATWASVAKLRAADEVWIHCGWLPCLWWAALVCCLTQRRKGAERAEKVLKWMPEACYDPVRLHYHGWKKWLVGPIERFLLRRCSKIVATCEAEKGWIETYLGDRCPAIEVTDIKRFFKLGSGGVVSGGVEELVSGGVGFDNSQLITHNSQLHLLYLGRRHPLKGVEYLEAAVRSLKFEVQSSKSGCRGGELSDCQINGLSDCCSRAEGRTVQSNNQTIGQSDHELTTHNVQLKIVSNAFGEELEKIWAWCDVLVLPTLSENFGLVVAEALERGKRVITTDGAPAWGDGSTYGGRLTYLRGYREGSPEERISLLKSAIENIAK